MADIEPKVGAIVLYFPNDAEIALYGCAAAGHPALVTEARGSEVSLAVIFGGVLGRGGHFAVARANYDYNGSPSCWCWRQRER